MDYMEIRYKGHAIMKDIIMGDGWTVYCEGDECFFKTVDEAKRFIDEVLA